MSLCSSLSAINISDCFGPSLDKINANFALISTTICALSADVEAMREVILTEPGIITLYAGVSVPPSPWLVCDGSELLKTDYPTLAVVLGDTFGAASTSSYFKLPNPQDRLLVMSDNSLSVDYSKEHVIVTEAVVETVYPLKTFVVKSASKGGGWGSAGNGSASASGNVQTAIFDKIGSRPLTSASLAGTKVFVTADAPNDYSVGTGKVTVNGVTKTSSKGPGLGTSNPVRFTCEVVSYDGTNLFGTIDGAGSYNFSTINWSWSISCTTDTGLAAGVASASTTVRFPKYTQPATPQSTSTTSVSADATSLKWVIHSLKL